MADDDDKGGQGGGQGPAEGGQGDGLEARIEAVVRKLLGGSRGGGRAAAGAEHDVTAQVEAAVARVHQGQKAESVMADLEKRLKAVEERKVPEAKPREFRPISRLMGWVSDDD